MDGCFFHTKEKARYVMCNNERGCFTINCMCGSGNPSNSGSGDSTPVGTVISYMGTKAPQHYLICDGAVLNIADYQQLSGQIYDEFGAINYFGGDGTTTFAVPDLRNEFLRGFHGEGEERLSGELGEHQDATQLPYYHLVVSRGYVDVYGDSSEEYSGITNSDKDYPPAGSIVRTALSGEAGITSATVSSFTSRPTNVAVLYCIKYE